MKQPLPSPITWLRPAAVLLLTAMASPAALMITYAEDPGETNSSLKGTDVFTFDSLKTGRSANVAWAGVGTFDQLQINNADAYGGAVTERQPNGSRYSVQGAGSAVLASTLKLKEGSSYFGLWWSAGDARNVLQFYNGNELVGQFTTATLMDPLPAEYDGNPRDRAINRGEPYAFINFYGDENTVWDRIILTNNSSSGFESDNYTSRAEAWNPLVDGALPGVPVALVSGTKTTPVTAETLKGTLWAAAPGAPLPPLPMLLAFGVVVLVKGRRLLLRAEPAA